MVDLRLLPPGFEVTVEELQQTLPRALRFAVLWRKRSLGTKSDKGDRWVERILSLRQTCRVRGRQTFPVLVEAMTGYFKGQPPDIAWISQA
jgi:transposase